MVKTEATLSRSRAEWLLAFVILARSISFVMTKTALQYTNTFSLLGIRFLCAFLLLLLIGWKRLRGISRATLLRGMLLGGAFFSVMAAEVQGLKTANASTAAFLENTAIVFVPLFEAVLRRRFPRLPVLASVAISLCGVALLTLKGGVLALSGGELYCLLAAMLYASAIILTDRISKRDDPLVLGMLQVGFIGAYSMVAACVLQTPKIPTQALPWAMILALAVICTGFGFTLQPLAQSGTTAERAGLFCALGPVGATISGVIFLHERLEITGMMGIALILGAMVFSNLQAKKQMGQG